MASRERPNELAGAFEEALRSLLPPNWGMSLDLGNGSGKTRADGYLDLTPPVGDRIRACIELKTRAEPSEVVRLVPWLQGCGPAILVAPLIGARARHPDIGRDQLDEAR
jgi:hypothetical protein